MCSCPVTICLLARPQAKVNELEMHSLVQREQVGCTGKNLRLVSFWYSHQNGLLEPSPELMCRGITYEEACDMQEELKLISRVGRGALYLQRINR